MRPTLRSTNNFPPPMTPLGFKPVTSTLIPLVGPQALPTLLKAIAVRKDAYHNLIVHSPKRPRRTQGELMDTTNPSICQHIWFIFYSWIYFCLLYDKYVVILLVLVVLFVNEKCMTSVAYHYLFVFHLSVGRIIQQ